MKSILLFCSVFLMMTNTLFADDGIATKVNLDHSQSLYELDHQIVELQLLKVPENERPPFGPSNPFRLNLILEFSNSCFAPDPKKIVYNLKRLPSDDVFNTKQNYQVELFAISDDKACLMLVDPVRVTYVIELQQLNPGDSIQAGRMSLEYKF